MSRPKLAIYGGPRVVTAGYRERWKRVPEAGIKSILKAAKRDQNTQAGATGPIAQFESKFCRLTQTKHGLLMNSGTATLHSAYLAAGVTNGDEVIVPAYTFFASAAPILACGGKPVFCEVDPETLTADPDDVEARITDKTKAICVVHVWGNPARMERFQEIRQRTGITLIEDCSHAHGASYDGKSVGSWGDIGCFSLQGNKPVSGGEMGIAVTNDSDMNNRMLALAHFGRIRMSMKGTGWNAEEFSYGLKYRPHLYGVLLANASLERLDELNALRRRNYGILEEELADCQVISTIKKLEPSVRGGMLEFILKYSPEHANQIPIGSIIKALKAEGVPAEVDRYTCQAKPAKLLHQTQLFQKPDGHGLGGNFAGDRCFCDQPSLPVSEDLARRLITLPPFTKVSERYVRQCGRAIRKVAEQLPRIEDYRTGG